ncbi:MAG: hypothetical protein H6657_22570 [Ardenticatenaceae bacterium]|nr:hypothetical protein [Ardenticatenaceae bacterium]
MHRFFILWLAFSLFLVGCSSVATSAATPASASVQAAATAVPSVPTQPTLKLATLPATQTAVPTLTLPPTADAPLPTSVIAQTTPEPTATFAAYGVAQTIGTSAGGRPLTSYRFGFGSDVVVMVGGMHGGYEWNTILLAYEMIDYFLANPDRIPSNVSLYIIPSANPDGQFFVTGLDGRFTAEDVSADTSVGRFNANQVDLNRNWACDWQSEALWGDTLVSGGTVPFSEPETAALRAFFLREKPVGTLFWHSKADGLFVGSCGGEFAPSRQIAELYGRASGYEVFSAFKAYPVSGDASDWLATQNIPSFTVELSTHSFTDFSENLAGVLALLDFYGRN